jgi:hypothetical protein
MLRQNQALLMEDFGTFYDPNLSPCAFAPGVIQRSEDLMSSPGSLRALLEAEAVRTGECAASSISPANKAMFALVSGWFEDNFNSYWSDSNAWIPESVQELALKTDMSEPWTCERVVDYLWRLENVYLEATRKRSGGD